MIHRFLFHVLCTWVGLCVMSMCVCVCASTRLCFNVCVCVCVCVCVFVCVSMLPDFFIVLACPANLFGELVCVRLYPYLHISGRCCVCQGVVCVYMDKHLVCLLSFPHECLCVWVFECQFLFAWLCETVFVFPFVYVFSLLHRPRRGRTMKNIAGRLGPVTQLIRNHLGGIWHHTTGRHTS